MMRQRQRATGDPAHGDPALHALREAGARAWAAGQPLRTRRQASV